MALSLALTQEEMLDEVQKKPLPSKYRNDMKDHYRHPFKPNYQSKGILGPGPEKKDKFEDQPKWEDRYASLKALRRARGECFKCDEKFGPGHKCPKAIQLYVMEEPRPTPLSASHGGGGGPHPLRPRPRRRTLACRAELQHDAPFAAAIGACVLASLALPPTRGLGEAGDEEEDGELGATDTRMAVMGIISFLPYFNWLSWIFAWLDSGKRRYLVYAAVYLAPYLRTNLSLSPDESWLPIASIFICILHIQLEAGIRSGDIEGFKFVEKAWKLFFPGAVKEKDAHHVNKRGSIRTGHRDNKRIPSAHESREKLRNSDIFKRRLDEPNDEKQKKSDWN